MNQTAVCQELSQEIVERQSEILHYWSSAATRASPRLFELLDRAELESFLEKVVAQLGRALATGTDIAAGEYSQLRETLEGLSTEMTLSNMTPTETASLIISLKESVTQMLRETDRATHFEAAILILNRVVDQLGLFTFEIYLNSKERIIREQQQALFDVSVPVVRIWDRILLVPLIGMIDSNRTQVIMESLLSSIEETQSKMVLIDISGIPVVDSLVARHLLMTVKASKLMGADCIVTGISSRISQTIVNLGADLSEVVTRSSLADGLQLALETTGQKIG